MTFKQLSAYLGARWTSMASSEQLPTVGTALVDVDLAEIQINFEHSARMDHTLAHNHFRQSKNLVKETVGKLNVNGETCGNT
jgi:hypothetical protein